MNRGSNIVRSKGWRAQSFLLTVSLMGWAMVGGCATGDSPVQKPPQRVEVCLNGTCGPASGRFKADQLLGGLLLMLKENENAEGILCDSDPKTRECVEDDISWFVQGGPIPGVATYGSPYLVNVGLDKETSQVKFAMAANSTWIGTPVFCQDAYTEVTVTSVDRIVMESPSFLCTWTVLPHVWNLEYFIGFIDFDHSIMAGTYSVQGGGFLVGGGGSGTFTIKFPKQHTLLGKGGDMEAKTAVLPSVGNVPSQILAAPVPKPEDIPERTKESGPEERAVWETAVKSKQAGGYTQYLAQYPDGRYSGAAKANLQAIAEIDKQNQELARWNTTRESTNPGDFESFIEKFPGGLFADLAALKARRLNAAATEVAALDAELAVWEEIKGSTDVDEIQIYLNRYPNGQFTTLARNRVKKLTEASTQRQDIEMSLWTQIKDSREISEFQNYLQAFPDGIFAELAKGRLQSLTALAAQTEELEFWKGIQASSNSQDFDDYLRRYPNGQFAGLAQQLSQQLASLTKERQELALWETIKDSTKPIDFDTYLKQYPEGRFTTVAKERKRKAEQALAYKGINFGRYHAIVIGNNDYSNMRNLITAVNDAKEVGALLEELYAYTVTYVFNGDREQIIDALTTLRRELTPSDNLLIYYAGHGLLDKEAGRGYWLPVDAKPESPANWISTADITDTLKALKAKHVIVVADSCYSGTLTRDIKVAALSSGPGYLQRLAEKRTRVALTSGGLEPVVDEGSGGHSVFANAFLTVLRENQGVLEGTRLFSTLLRPVMTNAQQTPVYADIRLAGHEGGDFLFVRK